MRILDLGCGTGLSIQKIGMQVDTRDSVLGIDVDEIGLRQALSNYPDRQFILARGEALPLGNTTCDFVLCNVALPYMDIPRALAEINRVLVPGGRLYLKLHPVGFTMKEFMGGFPRLIPSVFRLYVMANGFLFHMTGRTTSLLGRRTESFQTCRGLKIALERARFADVAFSRPDGKLIVEACKSKGESEK